MLTKEHANGITLERARIQFKNIATKVAAFCMQKYITKNMKLVM